MIKNLIKKALTPNQIRKALAVQQDFKHRNISYVANKNSSLKELGMYYDTDKWKEDHSFNGMSHLDIYSNYLTPLKENPINFLEIGVREGQSVRMWKAFFEQGKIFGIDIDPFSKKFKEDRLDIAIGDQANLNFLKTCFGGEDQKFDVILDDGSHVNDDIITSFEYLFYNRLNDGGLYIIEDLSCSYHLTDEVRGVWAGFNYYPKDRTIKNDRPRMNQFFNQFVYDLDHRKGKVQFVHFYYNICILMKTPAKK